ncbi:MAG: PepSY domain-containing protein [Desulfobacteraceae bacterium]|nr:PepSY domain-containing protein [Desulfobacteraceae bacterium]
MGLICLIWFIPMGISGVLINHPDLIRGLSVPSILVPPNFHYVNWNRMAMRAAVYSQDDPDTLFVCGRKGVWQSKDGGRTFSAMEDGYPASAFEQDTNCLLLMETFKAKRLYAGNRGGLFLWDFESGKWERITHKGLNGTEVKDLMVLNGQPLVFTDGECYGLRGPNLQPVRLPMTFAIPPQKRASMTRFMLRIHDGTIAGMPGRLFVDAMGLVMIFLSFSALGLWYLPWRRKNIAKRNSDARLFRCLHRYHLKLGIYSVLFLLVITATGMIIRTPFRQFISNRTVPAAWLHPGQASTDHGPGIRRAVYLVNNDTLLLSTRTGFFTGPPDFSRPFALTPMEVPVSGMGVNIMEPLSNNRLLIGSFNGLYIWNGKTGSVEDWAAVPGKPARSRAVGAAVKNGQLQFWADYNRGTVSAGSLGFSPEMPSILEKETRMSLWRYLRGVHTGHIFREWTGRYTWLIIPMGGLLVLISIFTGGCDWLRRKGLL